MCLKKPPAADLTNRKKKKKNVSLLLEICRETLQKCLNFILENYIMNLKLSAFKVQNLEFSVYM